ncbi:hypothetical protein EZ449_13845 [Pedobacter frigidisoli]|uniref:Uncharacterized protein n=1 Tax=Pedobacter frigidisoli TaxID=2530455 RepID=A0A4V2MMP1_9SPHI|nr:DUF5694 domain-containing protein [Pedobacter frigidisoli]TCD07616.1 hypothetical protein EZ449_13845 [Pedobacter frigidisoli]
MRNMLFLFLIFSMQSNAQEIDVLLIGVSHNYSKYPKQDFSDIYRKIENFKPEAFFGEFLSNDDERKVMDYWCKRDNLIRLNRLRNNRDIDPDIVAYKIDSLQKLSRKQPTNYELKVDLAHAYYIDQDVSNGHYLYWQIYERLQQAPDRSLQEYTDQLLSPDLDTTGRSMRRLKTSEYALIGFPMMQKLKIQELLPMDCQDYDLNWNASWAAFDVKFKEFRKDASPMVQKELKEKLAKMNRGFEEYDRIEKTSYKVTEWLNSPEASEISASGDFYLPELYAMKKFPKEEMLSKIHWWIMRNKGMCSNVVDRARKNGVKRVVVIAGANHRRYMQEIFDKMPGVKVRNINEVK